MMQFYVAHWCFPMDLNEYIWYMYSFDIQAKRGFAAGAVLFDLGGNGAFWKKRV
jgi:hypothetical protein